MQWFYYENDEKRGPVTAAQLKALADKGIVRRETIVETEEGRQAYAHQVQGLIVEPTTVSMHVPPPGYQPQQPQAYQPQSPAVRTPDTGKEQILYRGKFSRRLYIHSMITAGVMLTLIVLLWITFLVLSFCTGDVDAILPISLILGFPSAIFASVLFYTYVQYKIASIIITSNLVKIRRIGASKTIPVVKIQSVEVTCSFSEMLSKTRTLVILTGGDANANTFAGLDDAQTGADILTKLIQQ